MTTRETTHQPSRWERPLLSSGILFALAQIAAIVFFTMTVGAHMPPVGSPAPEHASFFVEFVNEIRVANYVMMLPAPLFMLFLGGLYSVLRRAEGDAGPLAMSVFGSGIAMVLVWPFGILMTGLGVDIAVQGGDPISAWVFDQLAPMSLALSAFPRTILLAGTGLLVLQSGIAPRWIGWLGLLLSLASLAGTGLIVMPQLFPLLALATLFYELWLLALSISLVQQKKAMPQIAYPVAS